MIHDARDVFPDDSTTELSPSTGFTLQPIAPGLEVGRAHLASQRISAPVDTVVHFLFRHFGADTYLPGSVMRCDNIAHMVDGLARYIEHIVDCRDRA